ncbi:MAG: hypothetical protein QOF76_1296, partial [Solirubrobacteraceae bacterium]|nr:hypothetical protein [Solirubrobacteraceae bacterium]
PYQDRNGSAMTPSLLAREARVPCQSSVTLPATGLRGVHAKADSGAATAVHGGSVTVARAGSERSTQVTITGRNSHGKRVTRSGTAYFCD